MKQASLYEGLLPSADFKIQGALLPLSSIIMPDDCEEPTTDFVKSVSTWGIIQPIIVEQVPQRKAGAEPKYRVRVGRRRFRSMYYCASQKPEAKDYRERVLKVDGATRDAFIPAGIVSGLPEKASADVLTLIENSFRSSNMMSECAAIVSLLEQGLDKKQVGKLSGLTSAEIDQRLRLKDLHPKLRELFMAGKLAQGVMMKASKLHAVEQARLADVADRRMRQDEEITRALTAEDIRDIRSVRQERALDSLGEEGLLSDGLGTGDEQAELLPMMPPRSDWKPRVKFHLEEALKDLRASNDAEGMTIQVDVESALRDLYERMGLEWDEPSELTDGNATVVGETEHTRAGLDEVKRLAEESGKGKSKKRATTKSGAKKQGRKGAKK